jgi:uncharacterized protein YbjT (DUF2867 family)
LRILVTGATGTVGRHVVEHLLQAGVHVRALTRNPEAAALPAGAEVVKGDLDDLDPVVFQGIDRMYLFPAGDTATIAGQVKQAGVRRIVTLSSLNGDEFHRGAEVAVEQTGLEWTHVRPGMFMANLLDWAADVRQGTVRAPYPLARQAPVHERDIAEVAATALLDDGHAGQAYPLTGPQSLTTAQQVGEISKALGKPIEFRELTPQEWKDQAGYPAEVADFLLGIWATADEPVLPTVEEVLRRPGRTLAEWARDHEEDFR